VALGLVTPFARAARAARTVLRGASRGFAAVLVARLRRGVGYAASPLTSQGPKIDQSAVAVESRKVETSLKNGARLTPSRISVRTSGIDAL
jgi:hypothetical protein